MGTTTKGISYPEPTDFVKDGATAIRALAEDVDERLPGARGRAQRTTTQSVANNTTEDVNTPTLVTADSSSEFTVASGALVYTGPDAVGIVTGKAEFAANASGYRRLIIKRNAAAHVSQQLDPDGGGTDVVSAAQIVDLVSGDTLSISVKQTSGGALTLNSAEIRVVVTGLI